MKVTATVRLTRERLARLSQIINVFDDYGEEQLLTDMILDNELLPDLFNALNVIADHDTVLGLISKEIESTRALVDHCSAIFNNPEVQAVTFDLEQDLQAIDLGLLLDA